MTTSTQPCQSEKPPPIHREILAADEYRLLCRLRQLKAKRADIAIIIFKAEGMKVRELGE